MTNINKMDLVDLLNELKNNDIVRNKDYEGDFSLPFNEYINRSTNYNKFVAVITKNQYAIEVNGFTHEAMTSDLIKRTRPDIKVDVWGNALNPDEAYSNGNIIIAGYPYYILIELPKKTLLSVQQFECLKDVLLDVQAFNKVNKERGYGRDFKLECIGSELIKIDTDNSYESRIDELIGYLSNFVIENVEHSDEVIIGTKFECELDL